LRARFPSRVPGTIAWVEGTYLRLFVEVLDVVLEDEEVWLFFPSEPDERLIVILDHADDFLTIEHFDANRFPAFDQLLEVFGLFECVFRGSRLALCRTRFS